MPHAALLLPTIVAQLLQAPKTMSVVHDMHTNELTTLLPKPQNTNEYYEFK